LEGKAGVILKKFKKQESKNWVSVGQRLQKCKEAKKDP
jgi:hypothetical protein